MIVEYGDDNLRRLYEDASYRDPRLGPELLRSYRKVVGVLHDAVDDRDVRRLKALRLERLQGDRAGQNSLRLHGGHRLIVRFRTDSAGRVVVVVEIVDYH